MEQFSAARNRPPPLSNSRPFSIWSISIPADDFLLCDAEQKEPAAAPKSRTLYKRIYREGNCACKRRAHISDAKIHSMLYTVWQSKRIVRLPRLKASRNRNLAGCCDRIKFAALSMLLAMAVALCHYSKLTSHGAIKLNVTDNSTIINNNRP